MSIATSHKLHIKPFALGDWMTNCYVLHVDARQACWIVDAGFEPKPMIRYIEEQNLRPEKIVLTHAHVDHIAGLDQLHRLWPDAPILIHELEADFLAEPMLNLSIVLDEPIVAPSATSMLRHGNVLELDGLSFEVRHTPGHSPGGISLYQAENKVALVGDALFAGSVGRTDFPTSNQGDLIRSIHEQLLTLPDQTRVLSGHGPETTIGRERAGNPFLQG